MEDFLTYAPDDIIFDDQDEQHGHDSHIQTTRNDNEHKVVHTIQLMDWTNDRFKKLLDDELFLVKYFQKLGIIRSSRQCDACGRDMRVQVRSRCNAPANTIQERVDKMVKTVTWQCKCKRKISIREGSPFLNLGQNHNRLPLTTIVTIIRCWSLNMSRQDAVTQCRTGRDAVSHWFNRCRQACYKMMLPEEEQRRLNATVASVPCPSSSGGDGRHSSEPGDTAHGSPLSMVSRVGALAHLLVQTSSSSSSSSGEPTPAGSTAVSIDLALAASRKRRAHHANTPLAMRATYIDAPMIAEDEGDIPREHLHIAETVWRHSTPVVSAYMAFEAFLMDVGDHYPLF